jgi:hypothetical protein
MATLPAGHEMVADFARDGVACVHGVLDPAELAVAARAIAKRRIASLRAPGNGPEPAKPVGRVPVADARKRPVSE